MQTIDSIMFGQDIKRLYETYRYPTQQQLDTLDHYIQLFQHSNPFTHKELVKMRNLIQDETLWAISIVMRCVKKVYDQQLYSRMMLFESGERVLHKIPKPLREECINYFTKWNINKSTSIDIHSAIGIVYVAFANFRGDTTTIQPSHIAKAYDVIANQYNKYKGYLRFHLKRDLNQSSVEFIIEKIQFSILREYQTPDIFDAQQVLIMLQDDFPQRHIVRSLYTALSETYEDLELSIPLDFFKTLADQDIISQHTYHKLQKYINPIFKFVESVHKVDECSLCYDSQELFKYKNCSHSSYYCQSCLIKWFRQNETCPTCRQPVHSQ